MSDQLLKPCPLCEGPAGSDFSYDEKRYCCASDDCEFQYVDVTYEVWQSLPRRSDAAPLVEALQFFLRASDDHIDLARKQARVALVGYLSKP